MDTAVIIPVFNRRETTSRCLRSLRDDGVIEWATIYVVDDGSTDGTAEMLRHSFPEVRIVAGNGNLWWTGATELGMRQAFADGALYFLWLNNDTTPAHGACAILRSATEQLGAIVSGQCYAGDSGPLVYGGMSQCKMRFALVEPRSAETFPVQACGGNFVCIPRKVVDLVGFPDGARLPHAFGDLDYAVRASRAGITVYADPRARATATPNNWKNHASWLLGDISVADIWRGLWQKHSYSYAPAHIRFLVRHFGAAGAAYWVWAFFKRAPISLLRLTLPQRWLRFLWGRHSAVWRDEQRLHNTAD